MPVASLWTGNKLTTSEKKQQNIAQKGSLDIAHKQDTSCEVFLDGVMVVVAATVVYPSSQCTV